MLIIFFAVLVGTAVAAHLNTYDSDNKIIGGFDCPAHSQPWQVAFTYRNGARKCGGSLINNRWIITAAHCFDNPDTFVARLGKHDGTVQTEQIINLEKAIHYPKYTNCSLDHDIMLVKLAEPAKINKIVKPIKISKKRPKTGTSCLVSGWGKRHPIWGAFPKKLQCLKVPIISFDQCKDSYPHGQITSSMFCAGYAVGGKSVLEDFIRSLLAPHRYESHQKIPFIMQNKGGTFSILTQGCGCRIPFHGSQHRKIKWTTAAIQSNAYIDGDSGGPLVCNGELTGVVSGYGQYTVRKNFRPSVFTSVSKYIEWIEEMIANN